MHASTEGELFSKLERFAAFGRLRDRAEAAIGAFDFKRDVRPWLGEEAAVVATSQGTAILLAVTEEPDAQAQLVRISGAQPSVRHEGTLLRRFDGGSAAFTGGFLVLGTEAVVKRAIELDGGGRSLAELPAYRDLERPGDRELDAWFDGRAAALLLPGRVASILGGRRAAASVVPTDGGLRIEARRLGGAGDTFAPELLGGIPADAFAYVGLPGLRELGRLLPAAAGDAAPDLAAGLEPLLEALDSEVAVSAAPDAVTLVARTGDVAAAREALAGLQGTIAAALTGAGKRTGQVPVFAERDLGGGLDGYALTLAGGGELVYAVADDRVAVSNSEDGVRRALRDADGLAESDTFDDALTDVPDSAQALAFLASNQLLELADEAGLGASPEYRAARADLDRIRALGAVVRRQGNDTTAELNLLFP